MVGKQQARSLWSVAVSGTLLWAAGVGIVGRAAAQPALWNRFTNTLAPSGPSPRGRLSMDADPTLSVPPTSDTRGPLARIVPTPQTEVDLPPYALADQAGTIQRYVEPVPGIDLEPYVNHVVVVRHDTGSTLLASQLELPPLPLIPLLGEPEIGHEPQIGHTTAVTAVAADWNSHSRPPRHRVAVAQFVDDDDATVQLLPEGDAQSDGGKANAPSSIQPTTPGGNTSDAAPSTEAPGEELPSLPSLELPPEASGGAGAFLATEQSEPTLVEPYVEAWESTEPCPECGGFHASMQCDASSGDDWGPALQPGGPPPTRLFADVELNLLRTHLNGSVVGKLSEKYEFSPRVIVGFRDTGKLDGRIRYWHYDRDTPVLGGSPIALKFDVLDIEGTRVLAGHGFEVQLAGGLRLAGIDLEDDDNDEAGADLVGMTFAIEGRTLFAPFHGGQISWVYGGRLSILGGDWGAEAGNDFVPALTQDDNVVVHELLAGIDYTFRHRGYDLHARLGFEMQNWHSDVLSPDSIGILGPNIQVGVEF